MPTMYATCPICTMQGQVGDDGFELRGKWNGYPVLRCPSCNGGMTVKNAGRAMVTGKAKCKPLDATLWRSMSAEWDRNFGPATDTRSEPIGSSSHQVEETHSESSSGSNPMGVPTGVAARILGCKLDLKEIADSVSQEPFGEPMNEALFTGLLVGQGLVDQHHLPSAIGMHLVGAYTAGCRLAELVLGVPSTEGLLIDEIREPTRGAVIASLADQASELQELPILEILEWMPKEQTTWFVAVGKRIIDEYDSHDTAPVAVLSAFVAGYARVARMAD